MNFKENYKSNLNYFLIYYFFLSITSLVIFYIQRVNLEEINVSSYFVIFLYSFLIVTFPISASINFNLLKDKFQIIEYYLIIFLSLIFFNDYFLLLFLSFFFILFIKNLNFKLFQDLNLVLLFFFVGFFFSLLSNTNHILQPTLFEKYLHGSSQLDDPISNLVFGYFITEYGEFTMGIDGFLPRSYHGFADVVAMSLAKFLNLNIPLIVSYVFVNKVFFLPLFLSSFFLLLITLSKNNSKFYSLFLLIILKLIFIINYYDIYNVYSGVCSQMFSAILFNFGLIFIYFYHTEFFKISQNRALIIFLLFTILLTSSKVSAGYNWLGFINFYVLIFCNFKNKKKLFFVLLNTLISYFSYKFWDPSQNTISLNFFDLASRFDEGFLIYLKSNLTLTIYLLIIFVKKKFFKKNNLVPKYILVPLLISCLFNMLPGLLLELGGGAGVLFTSIPFWLFIIFIVIEFDFIIDKTKNFRCHNIVKFGLVIFFIFFTINNNYKFLSNLISQRFHIVEVSRENISPQIQNQNTKINKIKFKYKNGDLIALLSNKNDLIYFLKYLYLDKNYFSSPYYNLVKIGYKNSKYKKDRNLFFIPPNDRYYDFFSRPQSTRTPYFLFQSLTGLPQVLAGTYGKVPSSNHSQFLVSHCNLFTHNLFKFFKKDYHLSKYCNEYISGNQNLLQVTNTERLKIKLEFNEICRILENKNIDYKKVLIIKDFMSIEKVRCK